MLILLAFMLGILLSHIQLCTSESLQVFDQEGLCIKWLWNKSWIYLQGTIVGIVLTVAISIALIIWFTKIRGSDTRIIDKLDEISQTLKRMENKDKPNEL